MNKEKLIYLFNRAKKYKDDIKESYNETFKYTDVSFSIKDSDSEVNTETRDVDSTILKSQSFLANFLMSSIFSKSGNWATLKVNQELLKNKGDTNDEVAESYAREIDEVLEQNSNIVYFTNDVTNYYTETAKAILDCIKVGTGIRKIIELKSNAKPFTYAYQNLDNIFILEDNLGKPNIIFKKYIEKNLEDINDLFGHLGIKQPSSLTSEENLEEKITVIESIIGIFDENTTTYKYYHAIHTDAFEELLFEEELDYNPYTVFRWSVDSSNPWGIGIGRANLNLFKDLEEAKSNRKKHAKKIVTPPLNFYGSIDLINKASLKPGAKNYGGSGMNGDKYGVEPINIGTNLIPLNEDINDCRQRIREIYMAQPLGDVDDTRNRSATEMSLRHEMFRKEFSTTYELINTELLEPTFMNAYYILEKKGLLKTLEDKSYIDISQIQYVNELTKSSGSEDVINVIDFYSTIAQVVTEQEREYIFKTPELIEWSSKKMRVPLAILNNKEEIEQLKAQQQQLEQMQQLALVQEQLGKKQDVGIVDGIKEGVDNFEF